MGINTKLENKFIDMGEIFVDSLGIYPERPGKQLQTLRTSSEDSGSLDFLVLLYSARKTPCKQKAVERPEEKKKPRSGCRECEIILQWVSSCICCSCLSANTAKPAAIVSLPFRRSLSRCSPLESKTKANKAKQSPAQYKPPHNSFCSQLDTFWSQEGTVLSLFLHTPSRAVSLRFSHSQYLRYVLCRKCLPDSEGRKCFWWILQKPW